MPKMVIPKSLYPPYMKKKEKPQQLKIVQEAEQPALASKDKSNERQRLKSASSTPGPTPTAKKIKFIFPSPEDSEEEEINIEFTFMERRRAAKVPISSRIKIDQKWIEPGKSLTEVVSECLFKEEYYSTDLTDESAERLSNNLKNGNAYIIQAEMVHTLETSPPASPEMYDEDSE